MQEVVSQEYLKCALQAFCNVQDMQQKSRSEITATQEYPRGDIPRIPHLALQVFYKVQCARYAAKDPVVRKQRRKGMQEVVSQEYLKCALQAFCNVQDMQQKSRGEITATQEYPRRDIPRIPHLCSSGALQSAMCKICSKRPRSEITATQEYPRRDIPRIPHLCSSGVLQCARYAAKDPAVR
ncbi:hypothetical protein NDU88_005004 [Pleurodeles waltl]|uniref:Uncharacterized protein n=1 Tax=Pleurodeles waltl TaxID=8319 RepID=A0AAV7T9D0_PLEWA|nr:hypothetical protein NDU88_005004 [Pleurodeles waltl]